MFRTSGWSLLPGAPTLTPAGRAPARTMRLQHAPCDHGRLWSAWLQISPIIWTVEWLQLCDYSIYHPEALRCERYCSFSKAEKGGLHPVL